MCFGQHIGERPFVQKLHRYVERVVGAADVVNRHDIGMRDCARRFCFSQEAVDVFFVDAVLILEHLDGDGAVEFGVVRPIDERHRAFGHEAFDLVASDLLQCAVRCHKCPVSSYQAGSVPPPAGGML